MELIGIEIDDFLIEAINSYLLQEDIFIIRFVLYHLISVDFSTR